MARTKTKVAAARRNDAAPPPPAVLSGTRDEIMTLAEASAYLRLPEQDVLRLVREQGLPGRVVGNDARFLKEAIDDWLRHPQAGAKSSREIFLERFGVFEDDETLLPMLDGIYAARGRSMVEGERGP